MTTEQSLAKAFLLCIQLGIIYAFIAYGLGIRPASWVVVYCCLIASAVVCVISESMRSRIGGER